VRVARIAPVEKIPATECRKKAAESLIGKLAQTWQVARGLGGKPGKGKGRMCGVVWLNEASEV
jgi:hypothetical protein